MSDGSELDPAEVAAKWDEIAPGIDIMVKRIGDPKRLPGGDWLVAVGRRQGKPGLFCAHFQPMTTTRELRDRLSYPLKIVGGMRLPDSGSLV